MKNLELKQMESFVAGRRICEELPLGTELQMLMCLIQAEEDETPVTAIINPDSTFMMWWSDFRYMRNW